MAAIKGYYSIVQYCPDPSRLETVNVGVALFCPEIRWLKARFAKRRSRIRHLFGKRDWDLVELQQSAIEARLAIDSDCFKRLEDFEDYVARRANAFVLTSPRLVKLQDPEQELSELVSRLVDDPGQDSNRAPKLYKDLGIKLQEAGVTSVLHTNVVVHPPSLPKPIKVPFAYQNGRLNLIEPMRLEGLPPSKVFEKVSVGAVEGSILSDSPDPKYGELRLVVVAKFSPEQNQERDTARKIFSQHHVSMFTFEALDPLLTEIRANAH